MNIRIIILALPLLAGILVCTDALAAKWPIPKGTFIQDYLVRDWGDAKWRSEFRYMKQVGMDTLIFGSACDSRHKTTYYPTEMPGFRQARGHNDTLGKCLKAAEKEGVKVFVGLNFHEDWWKKGATDPEWLNAQMRIGNDIADEIYKRYHAIAPNALYGWYWIWEVDNLNFNTPERRAALAAALDVNAKHLHSIAPTMPVMLCPFMNYRLGTPEEYGDMWSYVFANCSLGRGDIFAPQDCVGAGGLTLDRVPAWFSALGAAVKTKPGLRFWSDTETFDQTDWTSAPLDRFIAQMKAVQPYVESCITFAYSHYYSPNNSAMGFQQTLAQYVKTGRLEQKAPAKPAGVTVGRMPGGSVRLTWKPSRDDVGVCGYSIDRDGTFIGRSQALTGTNHKVANTYVDKQSPDVGAVYTIRAYDFAGNKSPAATAIVRE
jgi:hypothetical protein